MECIFLMVISSESHIGQYRDDDHREDARHFTLVWLLEPLPILEVGKYDMVPSKWPHQKQKIKSPYWDVDLYIVQIQVCSGLLHHIAIHVTTGYFLLTVLLVFDMVTEALSGPYHWTHFWVFHFRWDCKLIALDELHFFEWQNGHQYAGCPIH